MAMFEEVQARKRERMAMNKEQEQMRLEQQQQGSDKTVSVLENIAANSTDPQVQLEALKQLAELRKRISKLKRRLQGRLNHPFLNRIRCLFNLNTSTFVLGKIRLAVSLFMK